MSVMSWVAFVSIDIGDSPISNVLCFNIVGICESIDFEGA